MTTRTEKRAAARCLTALTSAPWAITEAGLRTMLEIAARENLAPEMLEAMRGERLDNARDVTVRDGVASIDVNGPLFRHADLFTAISGATSYDTLARDLRAALADDGVHAILLSVDSPGGEANGVAELAGMIREANAEKPVVAYVGGMGASAAYWLASAAGEVVVNETALLGSIGVVFTHIDQKAADEKRGIRRLQIVSSQSPNKRLDPTEDAGRAEMQRLADDLAAVFVDAVAEYRGVSVETVLADFGQGGVMIGADAVAAGLADRVSTYERVHAELAALAPTADDNQVGRILSLPRSNTMSTKPRAGTAGAASTSADPAEGSAAGNDSDATAALPANATAAQVAERYPTAATALRAEGATAERTRITAIQELAVEGADSIVAEAVNDPAATPEATAMKILRGQRDGSVKAAATKPAGDQKPADGADAKAAGNKHLEALAADEKDRPNAQPLKPGIADANTSGPKGEAARMLAVHRAVNTSTRARA